MTSERIRLIRAELYEKVWATPMRTLAKEFGMSDVGLAKICRKHNIPVPPVGYWRRKETGYKVNRPRLPALKDGVEFLDIYIRERLHPEFDELTRQAVPEVAIPNELSHTLVLRSEKLLAHGKTNQRGLVISKNGALAHLLVSREQLPRALIVLNALLLALEAQ
jgi:transglutaminase-like putative cysteine protease